MKKRLFLMMVAPLLTISMTAVSCSEKPDDSDDPPVVGDKTLVVSPAKADFAWFSPEPITLTVATDADSWTIGQTADWYTAEKSGTDKIVLTAKGDNDGPKKSHTLVISAPGAEDQSISVTQAAVVELHSSLKGSQYIVFQLDETSYSYIEKKILKSHLPDSPEGPNNLWIWTGLEPGTASGLNFYGLDHGWAAFVTAGASSAGWSGGGYNYAALAAPDFSMLDDDWYFHVVFKGTATAKYEIVLDFGNSWNGNSGKEYKFNIGADTDYTLSMSEWREVEIPLSTLLDAGWLGLSGTQMEDGGCNGFTFLLGNVDGNELQWDALFFYKK